MGPGCLEGVEDILDAELEILGQLEDRGRAVEAAAEQLLGLLDLDGPLLGTTGDVNRPSEIAEVALELAEDGGNGKRREGRATAEVVAVDGLDEAKARDLQEVVERLAGPAAAAGELAGEGQ